MAAPYEVNARNLSEQALYELAAQGDLSDESLQSLLWLLHHPVDLSSAKPEEIYALPDYTWEDVNRVLETRPPEPSRPTATGSVQLQARSALQDPEVPTAWLQANGRSGQWSFGLLAAETREKLTQVTYNPNSKSLSAPAPLPQFEIPKFFGEWTHPNFHVIVGTFTAGFGQRMTLDNSPLTAPNGFYADDGVRFPSRNQTSSCRLSSCSPEDRAAFATPDVHWTVPFRGAAVSAATPRIAGVTASLSAMASYQSTPVYQYKLFNRDSCLDPRRPDRACAAPSVFLRLPNETVTGSRQSFRTLQGILDEGVIGAHAEADFLDRLQVGATGYAARTFSKVAGVTLDLQEGDRIPFGGSYGAVGLNAKATLGAVQLFSEVARSFDHVPENGGGLAGLLRWVLSSNEQELDVSARYYSPQFLNRFAGSTAASDMDEGQRARNEMGLRLRYFHRNAWGIRLRTDVDSWMPAWPATSLSQVAVRASGRADWVLLPVFQPGVFATAQSVETCTGIATDEEASCEKRSASVGLRGRFVLPGDHIELLLQGRLKKIQQQYNASLYAQLQVTLFQRVDLRFRTRYLDESIGLAALGETSLWSLGEVTVRFTHHWLTRVRYDHFVFLDARPSTEARSPNPEHRFWLEIQMTL